MLEKNEILSKLKQLKPTYEKEGLILIGLFGSYAKSNNTKYSDIDILYDTKQGITNLYDKKQFIKKSLEKIFNTKIDLASKKYLKPYVKDEIMKDLIYV